MCILDVSTPVCANTQGNPNQCQQQGYPPGVIGVIVITITPPSYYGVSPQFLDGGGGGLMPMLPKKNGVYFCDPSSPDCLLGKPSTNIPPRHLRILTAAVRYHYTNTFAVFGVKNACAHAVSAILDEALGNFPDIPVVSNLETYIKNNYTYTAFTDSSKAVAGDLAIQDVNGMDGSGGNNHIGICMDNGCHTVLSNGSTPGAFVAMSDNTFNQLEPNFYLRTYTTGYIHFQL